MPGIGLLRLLRLGGGAKAVKGATLAKAGASAIGKSKAAAFVSQLPVVRMIAGSAIGIAILDTWNSTVNATSRMLGVDGDTSSMLLGIGIVVCAALVLSSISSLRRSRNERRELRRLERIDSLCDRRYGRR